jgi:hypothetical protein
VTSLTIAGRPAARKGGGLAPSSNQAYKPTLLCVEQDRADFESWIRLDCLADLQGGAANAEALGCNSALFDFETSLILPRDTPAL